MSEAVNTPAITETPTPHNSTLETAGAVTQQTVSPDFSPIIKQLNDNTVALTGVVKSLAERAPSRATPEALFGGQAPYGTSGPLGERGYSILRAAGFCNGILNAEQCKEEIAVSKQLAKMFDGYSAHYQGKAFLMVASSKFLPTRHSDGSDDSDMRAFQKNIREKMHASLDNYDPDEVNWINKRITGKALGTIADNAGGSLVGFPALGEVIDVQRNMEVFPRAGATEISLPANGRIQFPKITNGATAYNVGEAASITSSQPATGSLDLQGKKLGVLVPLNNELMRYTSGGSAEAMCRNDMARVLAIKADLDMLQGTGGTQIKGLITYPSASSWSFGNDKLLAYTVTSNLFQPNDPADMEAVMPDEAGEPTAWIVRRQLWAKIRNRRADAVSAADGKGPFVWNLTRDAAGNVPLELEGIPVVRSTQVSATRGNGSQTYVILGNFRDWIIARFGIMEFLANPYDSTAYAADQTLLRGIQILDAGPRHAASFVFADAITLS